MATTKSKSKPAPEAQPLAAPGSRIAEALAAIEREGISVAVAARRYELNESGIHAARRKARALAQRRCPACGGPVDANGAHVPPRRR